MAKWTKASDRGLIEVSGPEAESFLQGLISNDVTKADGSQAVYAALLTPQGKFLHDFFVVRAGNSLLLDCEAARQSDLFQRLRRYKLRAKVELRERADLAVVLVWGDDAGEILGMGSEVQQALAGEVIACRDPRLSALGYRLIAPMEQPIPALDHGEASDLTDHEQLRHELGVPEGSRDLAVDRALLLESGFEELNGVDWDKGCYVGQEVTARTKYRGLVRRRLTPVTVTGGAPADDGRVTKSGLDAGELRSCHAGQGFALLKLSILQSNEPLQSGEAEVVPSIPDWWQLPDEKTDTASGAD